MSNRNPFNEFRMKGNVIIPAGEDVRANVQPWGNSSETCPYNQEASILSTYVFNRKNADIFVKKGEGEYCWNSCNITDCPSYEKKSIKLNH